MIIRVRTKIDPKTKDWLKSIVATRRNNALGVIFDSITEHGLCGYEVAHDDGTHSYYEPHELTLVDDPFPKKRKRRQP